MNHADTVPARVLVIGATGTVGRLVVAAAARHGLAVRALSRDVGRAGRILPGTEIVHGDLEDPETLAAAVHGVAAVVFAHGARSAGAYERVDYGGVANVLRALDGRAVRIALMTSINVTRDDNGAYQDLLDWKRRSERLVRASGCPYTTRRRRTVDTVRKRRVMRATLQRCNNTPRELAPAS